jgi:predicted nucleic acid-binding protein
MTLDRERLVDVSYTNGLLQAALDKKIEILTSTLTIAECLYAGDRNDPVSDEVKNLFRSILESGKIVFLINADYFVMQRARDLRWTDGLQLGGADGIHVASAKEQKCTEFITVDGKIAERNDPDAFKSFGVHVIRPSKTIHLPTNYENMDLFAGDTPQ